MKVSASAPGKVILFGEHAVVYGVPAIAAATSDLRLHIDIEFTASQSGLTVIFHDIQHDKDDDHPYHHTTSKHELQALTNHITSLGVLQPMYPSEEALAPLRQSLSSSHDINVHALQGLMAAIYLIKCIMPEWTSSSSSSCDDHHHDHEHSSPCGHHHTCVVSCHDHDHDAHHTSSSHSHHHDAHHFPSSLSLSSSSSSYGMIVSIASNGLPIGAGLGSSAAYSVALAGALLLLRQQLHHDIIQGPFHIHPHHDHHHHDSHHHDDDNKHNDDSVRPPVEVLHLINAWAYASEVVIHGTPSGLDNYTSCYGGFVQYDKASSGFTSLPSLHREFKMLLTNTNIPRSTKVLVAGVRTRYDAYPIIIKPILEAIGGISSSFLQLLAHDDDNKMSDDDIFKRVGELVSMNHALLVSLGVSHAALNIIYDESCHMGYPAKLTGAGGGGCAITLIGIDSKHHLHKDDDKHHHDDKMIRDDDDGGCKEALKAQAVLQLKNKLRARGYDVFESALAGDGVLWRVIG